MRWPHLLIGVLLLANVVVDAEFLTPPASRALTASQLLIVGFAVYLSQVTLAGIWLAFGRTTAPLRILVTFFVLLGCAAGFTANFLGSTSEIPFSFAMGIAVAVMGTTLTAVSLPLLTARLLGLRILPRGVVRPSPATRQRYQFSIRALLGLTTVVAVILGTLKSTVTCNSQTFEVATRESILMSAAGCAAVAWLALWASMADRRTPLRLIVFAVAIVTASIGVLASDWEFLFLGGWECAIVCLLMALLLLGSLWLFRLAGYRLVFRRGWAAAEPQGSTETRAEGHG
jgi:hypothetical protein